MNKICFIFVLKLSVDADKMTHVLQLQRVCCARWAAVPGGVVLVHSLQTLEMVEQHVDHVCSLADLQIRERASAVNDLRKCIAGYDVYSLLVSRLPTSYLPGSFRTVNTYQHVGSSRHGRHDLSDQEHCPLLVLEQLVQHKHERDQVRLGHALQ